MEGGKQKMGQLTEPFEFCCKGKDTSQVMARQNYIKKGKITACFHAIVRILGKEKTLQERERRIIGLMTFRR